jgi:hypothetical protein
LRSEFRALAFPIDDGVCDALFVALSEKKPEFVRADANGDGELDVSDAVLILLVLFAGAQADCSAAGDANDDGELNVSDPIQLLQYLFLGAEPPRSPFPECGVDPTADLLTCPGFKGCL